VHIVLKRRRGLARLGLRELWEYRELVGFLVWKDILVRYKQTVIGIAWAAIRPLSAIFVFTFVFGRLAKLPSDGLPYPLIAFAGVLPWQLFATAFAESSASVVGNAQMVSKVYFPRLIVPISSVASALVDFGVTFVLVIAAMVWYGIVPGPRIVLLPLFLLLCLAAASAGGILFAALFVRYRDVRHIVGFGLQLGAYISPVGFTTAIVPEKWRLLYALNPLVGAIEGFRWCLLGHGWIDARALAIESGIVVAALVFALYYFRATEATFADVI